MADDEELRPGDAVVWNKDEEGGLYQIAGWISRVDGDTVTIHADEPFDQGVATVIRHVRPDTLVLAGRGPQDNDDLIDTARRLFEEGEAFLDDEWDEGALACFRTAWHLLPEPKEEQDSAFQILCSLGDAYFFLRYWHKCQDTFQQTLRHWDVIGDPFIRMRLGQSLLEIGNLREAANWMAFAYIQEGKQLFENEDPKYLNFIKGRLLPPPGGWSEGW